MLSPSAGQKLLWTVPRRLKIVQNIIRNEEYLLESPILLDSKLFLLHCDICIRFYCAKKLHCLAVDQSMYKKRNMFQQYNDTYF
jgi:hypothetical protein